jgi:hypothetical protein
MIKETIAIAIIDLVLLATGFSIMGVAQAAPEFNHPKMTCDFIYFHDGEQNILRRCYDEQNNATCYISEYLNAMSCVPGRE